MKSIKEERNHSDSLDNRLNTRNRPENFSATNILNMSSTLFDSASFSITLLFVEKIFNEEKYIHTLVSECKNDPTLTLNLQIILEAKQLELQLMTKEKYWDPNTSSANIILKTAIAAAIRHGILNIIKDSGKLPLIPTNITNYQFAGRGIINYL